jgi:hypothetical protein
VRVAKERTTSRKVKVTITRRGSRHQLTCTRADGTCDIADLGPALPHHDLAHFVIERRLGLNGGFFGRIAAGWSAAQLSDKEIIRNSPPEAMVAEVFARALQSLSSGACTSAQFAELVNAELSAQSIPALAIDVDVIDAMLAEFRELQARFGALQAGEALQLEFRSESAPH